MALGLSHLPLNFRVDDVRPAQSPVLFPTDTTGLVLRVRLLVTPEIVHLLHDGDKDRSGDATLQSLGQTRETVKGTTIYGSLQLQQELVAIDATFRVGASPTPGSWQYAGRPLRAGELFGFETNRYTVSGPIVDVQLPATAPGSPQSTQ